MITYVYFQCSAPNTYVSPLRNLYTILFVCFQIFIMIDFYFIHICDVYAMWVYMCTCVDQKRLLEPLELDLQTLLRLLLWMMRLKFRFSLRAASVFNHWSIYVYMQLIAWTDQKTRNLHNKALTPCVYPPLMSTEL